MKFIIAMVARRHRLRRHLGLCALAAVAASSAGAQANDPRAPIGSRIPRAMLPSVTERPVEFPEVRLVQTAMADCIVKKKHAEARTFVLNYRRWPSSDRSAAKLIKALADGNCLLEALGKRPNVSGAKMTLPGDTMQYILADGLIRAELSAWPALVDLKPVPPLVHPVFHESDFAPEPGRKPRAAQLRELAKYRAQEVERIYLSRFGECVVRANPRRVHQLLSTPVAGQAESAALTVLSGTFKSCLLDDQTVVLNKTLARGTLALNYYRLAYALRANGFPAGTRH